MELVGSFKCCTKYVSELTMLVFSELVALNASEMIKRNEKLVLALVILFFLSKNYRDNSYRLSRN